MSTTANLGRVKPIYRGVYDPNFNYKALDFFKSGSTHYFVTEPVSGVVPPNASYYEPIEVQDIDTSLFPYLPQGRSQSFWVQKLAVAAGLIPRAPATLSLEFTLNKYLIEE